MYTDNEGGRGKGDTSPDNALRHIYSRIWVETVVRSPLYRAGEMITPDDVAEGAGRLSGGKFEIRSTNFEKCLDEYLGSMSWFR